MNLLRDLKKPWFMPTSCTCARCAKAAVFRMSPTCWAYVRLVMEFGGDEDQAIAALLHDAVEDQGGDATRQEIRKRFGERVAAIVDGCSDSDQTQSALEPAQRGLPGAPAFGAGHGAAGFGRG